MTSIHEPSVKLYLWIWAWLAGLMLVGVLISYLPFPHTLNVALILGLSVVKVSLVALYYMHLRFERVMPVWVVAIFPFFLLFLAFLVILPGIVHAESVLLASRDVELVYAGEVGPLPADAQEVRVWIPLARSRDGQQILEREVRVGYPSTIQQESVYGNEFLYVVVAKPLPQTLPFEIRYRARIDGQGRSADEPQEGLRRYLQPTRLMRVTEEVEEQARMVAAAGQFSVRDQAKGIYDHVIRTMVYDRTTPGWGQGDTLRACRVGRGNCTDFHSLFIPMAHALGIPARFKIGFQIPKGDEGTLPGYHCWAEFYEPGAGWVPIDASEAWKHPENREAYFGGFDASKFLVSVGRDLELVPRQAGEPVNIFFDPYVEVDGQVFEGRQLQFSFVEPSERRARR